ncbi:MAG TPA: fumarate hydratase [Euryarchaeota archaeon]|nr:fumarate hydratase [Euryarchaeota archaeon]
MITEDLVREVALDLLRRTVTRLPADVEKGLKDAFESETEEVPKMQLKAILENIKLAKDNVKPVCQDTGITIFYVSMPTGVEIDVEKAITEGVRQATKEVPLRPNAVHPMTRKNPGDNVGLRMPYFNYKFWDRDYLEITVMAKGAGSENMSKLAMLTPSQGIKGIKEFVLNEVVRASGNPCPPTIVGLGIGGSADISGKLAKEALMRPIDQPNEDPEIAKLEKELKEALNELGIGPMGLGGKTTVLGVNIEYAYCHTASLPVSLNFQCWAARRGTVQIHPDGTVKHITHEG